MITDVYLQDIFCKDVMIDPVKLDSSDVGLQYLMGSRKAEVSSRFSGHVEFRWMNF
ncbi:hypothetical protein [Borrelia persica]|uniref:hypothetical protein n=1 Tax=Borrelia persica TaxID=44448 RepID=UPI00135F17AD|nr:hypothetical protein [Borrelia persica]